MELYEGSLSYPLRTNEENPVREKGCSHLALRQRPALRCESSIAEGKDALLPMRSADAYPYASGLDPTRPTHHQSCWARQSHRVRATTRWSLRLISHLPHFG